MGKIVVLPKEVAGKIAAGEVVESTAGVVKELVENALDAKASEINIEIENGGIDKIRVIDNGTGMAAGDLAKCFERYATSKLPSGFDLGNIRFFGFRGEALPSIASVSKIVARSKNPAGKFGNFVEVIAGSVARTGKVGMPTGTDITVSDLFYNTPARKKFLKQPASEYRRILDVVGGFALAFPKTRITLSHNGKVVLEFWKNTSTEDRLGAVLGNYALSQLISVAGDFPYVSITGFVCRPQLATKSKSKQFVFVNNRRVAPELLSRVVKAAYGNLLSPNTHPVFVLFLRVPYNIVDVNVHPRKEEVRFANAAEISKCVEELVLYSLQKNDLTYITQGFDLLNKSLAKSPAPKDSGFALEDAEILQVHNMYLIKPTPTGLEIYDQHAAHERVLYERFLESFEGALGKSASSALQVPVALNLSAADAQLLRENADVFNSLGFCVEDFGDNAFKVSAVPAILQDRNVVGLVVAVLDDLAADRAAASVDAKSKLAISYLACRSAIKSGDPLSLAQRQQLLFDVGCTKTKYTCPHGRPVKIEVSMKELNKLFKR